MERALAALLRKDLRYFIQKVFGTVSPGERYMHNWHIDAIVYRLMLVHCGRNRRLLINQPPRSLKSICVSVAYVAWLLGHDPSPGSSSRVIPKTLPPNCIDNSEWSSIRTGIRRSSRRHAGQRKRASIW